ncbi:MAG: acyl-CoA dehydrogenase, partial [Gammaproteobacteria bacterium]
MILLGLTLLALLALGLGFVRAPLWLWCLAGAAVLIAITATGLTGTVGAVSLWTLFACLALLFNLRPLRRRLITRHLLAAFSRALPRMSDT